MLLRKPDPDPEAHQAARTSPGGFFVAPDPGRARRLFRTPETKLEEHKMNIETVKTINTYEIPKNLNENEMLDYLKNLIKEKQIVA